VFCSAAGKFFIEHSKTIDISFVKNSQLDKETKK